MFIYAHLYTYRHAMAPGGDPFRVHEELRRDTYAEAERQACLCMHTQTHAGTLWLMAATLSGGTRS